MVTEFGLSRLGPIFVKGEVSGLKLSVELANDIDNEWRRILAQCYARAMQLVIENSRRVERIADELLAEQTLLSDRFLELWSNESSETRSPDSSQSPASFV